MPNGRFLSKSIAQNEQLAAVSLEADYLFARCIPHLDVEGRMAGNPKLVKSIAVPLRDEMTIDAIPALLDELVDAGLVLWYEADGRQVLAFPGFERHQSGLKKDREAPSRFPPPRPRLAPEPSSGTTQDEVRSSAGPAPEKVALSEVKGSEVKVKLSEEPPPPPPASPPARTNREAFLASLPDGQSRTRWEAQIAGWLQGLGLSEPATEADVDTALGDYLTSERRDYSPRHIRGYVRSAIRARTHPPPETGPPRSHAPRKSHAQQTFDTTLAALEGRIA